jgi:hypothetical protein
VSAKYRFHRELLGTVQQVRNALQKIDGDPLVERYGPAVKDAKRKEAILTFKEVGTALTDSIIRKNLPAEMAKQQAAVERAIRAIRSGRHPEAAAPSTQIPKDASPELRQLTRIADRMESLAAAQSTAHAMQVSQTQSTPVIAARLAGYLKSATEGQHFPFRAYCLDCSVLPTLLAARAAAGDQRAAWASEQFDRIESALTARIWPERLDDSTIEELSKCSAVIAGIDARSYEADYAEAERWFAFVERVVTSAEAAAPPVPIAPMNESDIEVLAHISGSGSFAAAVSSAGIAAVAE